MARQKKIEKLLDKFLNGNLSGDEKKDLYNSVNKDDCDEHVTAWFYKIWGETPMSKPNNSSLESYNKLKLKLKIENEKFENYNTLSNKKTIYLSLVKYAAVFILAFVLSWVLYNYRFQSNISEKILNEISIPNGSKGNIILPDGSKVWLNSGSRLSYSDFTNSATRDVFLEGEAFFDVKSNKNKPFFVNTSSLKIKVLGTKFNVKSYPDEKTTEAILVSGKVEIESINSQKVLTLKPNQKVTFNKESLNKFETEQKQSTNLSPQKPIVEKISGVVESVNTETATAWKDEKLIFNNEKFINLVVKLERWYDVKIELKDSLINNYRYTGTFEKENIEQALRALKLASPIDYKIHKNKVEINSSKR